MSCWVGIWMVSICGLPGCSTASWYVSPTPSVSGFGRSRPNLDGFALLGLYARARAADLAAECRELAAEQRAKGGKD